MGGGGGGGGGGGVEEDRARLGCTANHCTVLSASLALSIANRPNITSTRALF